MFEERVLILCSFLSLIFLWIGKMGFKAVILPLKIVCALIVPACTLLCWVLWFLPSCFHRWTRQPRNTLQFIDNLGELRMPKVSNVALWVGFFSFFFPVAFSSSGFLWSFKTSFFANSCACRIVGRFLFFSWKKVYSIDWRGGCILAVTVLIWINTQWVLLEINRKIDIMLIPS